MPRSLFLLSLCSLVLASSATADSISSPGRWAEAGLRWAVQTEGLVRGGTAVDADGALFFGSGDGWVYAVEAKTESLRWKSRRAAPVASTPAVSDGLVVVADRSGAIAALRAEDGAEQWSFRAAPSMEAGFLGWDYFDASPIIDGDAVLAGFGDGRVYALDLRSGNVRWNFATEGRIRAAATAHLDTVYVASGDGYVYALNRSTGELQWRFATDGVGYQSSDFGFDRKSIYAAPVVADGLLIVGARDGNVYAVDLETRKERWRFSYGTTWAMAVTVHEGAVYVGWSTNNLACSLDLRSGIEKWKFDAGGHVYGRPLVGDGMVGIASASGVFYCLEPERGEILWQYDLGRSSLGSPLFHQGVLYLGCDDGRWIALAEKSSAVAAVYQPDPLPDGQAFYLADPSVAPYLEDRGFRRLASPSALAVFLKERVEDSVPSVVVFAFAHLPPEVVGDAPETGPLRVYLEAGGKIVWPGSIPNLYRVDSDGSYRRDVSLASRLLGARFDREDESGCFGSMATQEGRNMGLPAWLSTMNALVRAEDVEALAIDELGRVGAWRKSFSSSPSSGFVSCRSWSYNVAPRQEDLELLYRISMYGLK